MIFKHEEPFKVKYKLKNASLRTVRNQRENNCWDCKFCKFCMDVFCVPLNFQVSKKKSQKTTLSNLYSGTFNYRKWLPVNSIPKVLLKGCKRDSKTVFSCSLGSVKDIFIAFWRRIENWTSSGLLTLGKPGRITTSTSDEAGLEDKKGRHYNSWYLFYNIRLWFYGSMLPPYCSSC